jgi:hypothetical protein
MGTVKVVVNGIGKSHWSPASLGRVFRQSLDTVPDDLDFTVVGLTPHFSSVPFYLTDLIYQCVLVDLLCRHEDSRTSAAQAIFTQRLSHRGKVVLEKQITRMR